VAAAFTDCCDPLVCSPLFRSARLGRISPLGSYATGRSDVFPGQDFQVPTLENNSPSPMRQ
jgi:hypothetical protein